MKNETMQGDIDSSNGQFRDNLAGREKAAFGAAPGIGQKHHILCVDDDVVGTRLRGQILDEAGYSVVLCHHPLEAICRDLSIFSLAVVDFEMPELNGRELLLRMRASGARFPIVLLTGCIDALSYEDRVLFARCINKDSPIQLLLNTIAEFLGSDSIPDFGS